MKRLFILLGLLVLFFDLADCAILGKGGFSDSPGLSQSASILPPPYFQHLKVVSGNGDFQVDRLPIFSHILDIIADIFCPFAILPVTPGVPHPLKVAPFSYKSSSGGIPW